MSEHWRPPSARGKEDSRFDGLHEGIPEWMMDPLENWLAPMVGRSEYEVDWALLDKIQLTLRRKLSLNRNATGPRNRAAACKTLLESPELCIDVLAFLVEHYLIGEEARRRVDLLEQILCSAGSAWTIQWGESGPYLAKRLDPPIAEAATKVMKEAPSSARSHLESAWRYVYGRSPNPDAGYNEAVKAIEVAICPVVVPKDHVATLGKAIRTMKQAPPGKFSVAISGPIDPLAHVRDLCILVWEGQARHGQPDPNAKRNQTQAEAEMALHGALALVQWFSKGMVKMAS